MTYYRIYRILIFCHYVLFRAKRLIIAHVSKLVPPGNRPDLSIIVEIISQDGYDARHAFD